MLTANYGSSAFRGAPPKNSFEASTNDFDEILPTKNTSRDSVYFISKNQDYQDRMRVFITYPYSEALGSINREFLGKAVRVEELGDGRRGIAVKILIPLYLGGKETVR